jgi:ribosomal protein S18 acetylase RimI-like enzyme
MSGEIVIRRGVPSDAATITDFNVRLAWESEELRLDPRTVRQGVEAVLHDRAESFYFVAQSTDEIAGQLMLTREWSDWRNGWIYWIQSVYVAEPFRRRGIFRQLFETARDYVQHQPNAVAIRLYVEEENRPAQESYLKLGLNFSGYRVMEWMKDAAATRE